MPRSVNEQLVDRTIRHAVYLERFKNNEVQDVVGFLNRDLVPDLVQRTERRLQTIAARGFDSGPWVTQRLKDMTAQNSALLREGMRQAQTRLTGSLVDAATNEAQWVKDTLSEALPIDIGLTMPNAELLRSIVTSQPMQGQVMGKWFSGLAQNTGRELSKQVSLGIASGETVDQIMTRIRGSGELMQNAFGGASTIARMNRDVRAVIRTSITHTTNHAKEAAFAANQDVIKAVQIVATLDSRTTEICMGQDGKVYPIGEGPRPPFHWNCRSTIVPVTKSWKEMGIALKDTSETTRASMGGQVPATQTYGPWLAKQPKAFQIEVLGPKRHEMISTGRLSVRDLAKLEVDGFKRLTIPELKQLEDMVEESAQFSAMAAPEQVAKLRELADQLDKETDPNKKKAIRARLRKLDPEWRKTIDRVGPGDPPLPVVDPPPPVVDPTPPPKVAKPDVPSPVAPAPSKTGLKTAAELREEISKLKPSQDLERLTKEVDVLQADMERKLQLLHQSNKQLRVMEEQIRTMPATLSRDEANRLIAELEKFKFGENAELARAYHEASSAIHTRQWAMRDLRKKLNEAVHEALTLAEDVQAKIKFEDLFDDLTRSMKARAQEASTFLSRITHKSMTPRGGSFGVMKFKGRAHYTNAKRTMWMDPSNPTKIYVHEAGHGLEYNSPGLREKTDKFFLRRTRGERARALNELTGQKGYGRDEVAIKDDFIDAYMGKIYPNATEIISMGLEYLYADPITFMLKDPDMFDFVVNAVRGL